jgi:hypothetical protein
MEMHGQFLPENLSENSHTGDIGTGGITIRNGSYQNRR